MAQKKDSKIYLYNQGDTCDSITGGWTVVKNAKFNDDSMTVSHADYGFRFTINKPVDLTNKLLCIQAQRTDNYESISYYLEINISSHAELKSGTRYIVIAGNNKDLTINKLSVKNGEFYVRIISYYGNYRIDKIWLEDKDAI